jgi:sugar/nucleoside kinase (ribokinase family)
MPEIAVIGRLYCDVIFTGLQELPVLGRERFAPSLTVTAGGGAFITSAWLRHLGVDPLLAADLGTDPFSALIGEALDAHGIGRAGLRLLDGPLPRITVAMPLEGDRAFLSHVAPAETRDLALLLREQTPRWLHVCEIGTLVEHPELISLARESGATLSADPSWDDSLLFDSAVRRLLAEVDLLLPNEEEARALTDGCKAEEAASALAAQGPVVVLKRGAGGVLVVGPEGRLAVPSPKAEVVDTTGAGDAFNAGFLAGRLQGRTLEEAARLGTNCGAQSVATAGGAPEL